ncbi:response regulator transcription factor [Kosakonia sp. MUSA4]|uniref:helix-turn-helix transcriptional regulator n=1 Tax=Kosakonia sp. MUSA4 TaxID=2067958 RepID=UPI0008BA3C7E|nr:response regulator transcription factor [Kosakonia sp. MUSA4]QJT79231.1 DNA-binding response regulator [Kosakonia sp. MUSA4]SEL15404.1 hypothetical protein SAMN04487787_10718 [Kosakonia sacchari]
MIFIMTKDIFLFRGVEHLLKQEKIIKIAKISDINNHLTDASSKVIIDVYHNNVLDDKTVNILKSLNVGNIFLLAPFRISKIKTRAALFFVSRKMQLENWLSLLTENRILSNRPQIGFSHNQFKIVSHFLNQEDPDKIASTLNISEQTLRSQKFNIMLKLKLRRMSDIATLKISPYF